MMENSIQELHCVFKVQERSTSVPYNQDHTHRVKFSSRYVFNFYIQISHGLLSHGKLKLMNLTLSTL